MFGCLPHILLILAVFVTQVHGECLELPKGMFRTYFRLWTSDLMSSTSLESDDNITTSAIIGQFIENGVPQETGIAIAYYSANATILENMNFALKAEANYGQRDYVRTVIFSDGHDVYKVLKEKSVSAPAGEGKIDRDHMYFYRHMLVVNYYDVIRPFRVISTDNKRVMSQFFEPLSSLVHHYLKDQEEVKKIQKCMKKHPNDQINPCIMDVTAVNNTIHEVVFNSENNVTHVSAFNGYVFSLVDFENFMIFNTTPDGKCFSGKTVDLIDKFEPPKGYSDPYLLTTIPIFHRDDPFFKKYAKPFDYHPTFVSAANGLLSSALWITLAALVVMFGVPL